MLKRIIINTLLSLILISFIFLLNAFIKINYTHQNTFYNRTFSGYIEQSTYLIFILSPSVFLICVLLPYNLIVLNLSESKKLTLLQKIDIFQLVMIVMFCVAGTSVNVWSSPYWTNLLNIVCFLPVSIAFATLIHYLIDKPEMNDKGLIEWH